MFDKIKKLFMPSPAIFHTDDLEVIETNFLLGASPIEPEEFQSFAEMLDGTIKIHNPMHGMMPFEPYDFQRTLANTIEANRITLVLHARQMGITTIEGCFALYSALIMDNQSILVISNNFASAKDLCRRTVESVYHLDIIHRHRSDRIILKNGSTISFQGMREEYLHGPHAFYHNDPYDVVIIDNANFIPLKWVPSIEAFIQKTQKTKFLIASAVGTTGGELLHRLYNSDIEAARVTLPWTANTNRDDTWADPWREYLGPTVFSREFDCEIVTDL